jgi:hypothetical protein
MTIVHSIRGSGTRQCDRLTRRLIALALTEDQQKDLDEMAKRFERTKGSK